MQDLICNLNGISALLNSAVDNLFLLQGELEPGGLNVAKAHNAMYGVCAQLEEVATALRGCIDALEFGEKEA